MQFNLTTYTAGNSYVHRCDTRVKLTLLLAYSITLFLVHTWTGLFAGMAVCLLLCYMAQVPLRSLLKMLIPVYFILAFTLLFNSFTFNVDHLAQTYGLGDVSAGIFTNVPPVPLLGTFGFVPEGFARGCFYALRIVFLVLASLLVTVTTTSTDLISALNSFLRPLRISRIPVDDIAMIVSIALRFIPVMAEELMRVYSAQWARGASFGTGSLWQRIKAWQPVFIPLFVGLFRRADNLAVAMESRCYGLGDVRTELHIRKMTVTAWSILAIGLGGCVAVGVFL